MESLAGNQSCMCLRSGPWPIPMDPFHVWRVPVRALIRSLGIAVVMFTAAEAALSTAAAQGLPFDPSAIDSLSPEQRQQALQTLGVGGNDIGSDTGMPRANAGVPDVSQLTPEQRQRLLEQLQALPPTAATMRGARATQYAPASATGFSEVECDGDGVDSAGRALDDDRRGAAGGSARGQDPYSRWLSRDRCRVQRQSERNEALDSADLQPFGYDLFIDAPSTFAPAGDIPVPSGYVVGPGDTIRVQLFGNENRTLTLSVSRDGNINVPKLGPVSVAGQRFEDVRTQIEDRVEREIIGTSASVTLGDLRSVRVFLLGDVRHPGSYTVSSLATISNALLYAGGVSPMGSLRKIQLKRDGKLIRTLDLYDLLLHGDSSQDDRLLPGDVVFVPPVGRRIAVGGEVKRPAIYEIRDETTLAQAIALAGGTLASGLTGAAQVQRFDANHKRSVTQVDLTQGSAQQFLVADGDRVQIRRVASDLENSIVVLGAVRYPGTYQWAEGMTLGEVLQNAEVPRSDSKLQVYMPLALIERTNADAGTRELKDFDLRQALADPRSPQPVSRGDRIIVLSRGDVSFLDSRAVRNVIAGNISQYERAEESKSSVDSDRIRSGTATSLRAQVNGRSCRGLDSLARLVNSQRALRYTSAFTQENQRTGRSAKEALGTIECPRIFDQVPEALPYLLEAAVSIYGEVELPGLYPMSSGAPLPYVIDAAGGLSREGDPHYVEYVSYSKAQQTGAPRYERIDLTAASASQIAIRPGDSVNVRASYAGQQAGTVRVVGEFRFPGTYGVLRDERLSQLMQRAGGLTPNAFPYGAVFTRESARQVELESNKRAARDLQDAMATAITSGAVSKDTQSSSQLVAQIVNRLENSPTIGRVVVEADPTMLQLHPEQDPVLEPGDAIVMPKRPVSVTVIGQVLNPGSVQFVSGQSARSYIDRAGGFSQAADKDRSFLILPNGTAQKLESSFWNFRTQEIPPGSVIVVPRNAAPFNLLVYSERVFGILGNLALTAAALVTVTGK